MTLYEYIQNYKDDEVTVYDVDYDIEVYFYKETSDDEWDKSMTELSKLLHITEFGKTGVTVDLSMLIENHLDNLEELFIVCETDAIMDDIENVLSGNVSEKWLSDFVKALQ